MGPPRDHPRNLVVLRAGEGSLHPRWLAATGRDFELFVSDYGPQPGRWLAESDLYEHRPGAKWPALGALLAEHPHLLDDYDAFWFPDDDLDATPATIERLFAFFHAHALHLAQPALTRDSFHTWSTLLQDEASLLRHVRFVEVMAPLFSRQALRLCAPTFAESASGWGLDWVWPALLDRAGLEGIAVIDATPVRHTRPVGGGNLYRDGMDPRADAEALVRRYGLQEVRAVAKWSIERRVQARALPPLQRLVHFLKRLNGRRKHLLAK